MKKYILLVIAVVFGLNLLLGCASAPIGSEKVIEWSPGYKKTAPTWTQNIYVDQKGYIYFTGIKTAMQNKDLGLRQAKAESLKNVAEGISMAVTTEFTDSVQGSNINEDDLGDYTRDAIGIVSSVPLLQGIQLEERYWQKVQKKISADEVKMIYNCFALVKLSVADYKKARDAARDAVLGDIVKKAKKKKDAVARDIAEKMMKRMTEE